MGEVHDFRICGTPLPLGAWSNGIAPGSMSRSRCQSCPPTWGIPRSDVRIGTSKPFGNYSNWQRSSSELSGKEGDDERGQLCGAPAALQQTGLRNSELIRLCIQDVQIGPGAHIKCPGKGRKTRCTPLRTDLAACLRDWIAEQPPGPTTPVFPTAKGSTMSSDAFQRLVGRHIKVAA